MKKEPIQNYKEWLEQDPIFEGENKEVFENADGSQYIPVAIVEGLLDWLTNFNWSIDSFYCTNPNTGIAAIGESDNDCILSASIGIIINYGEVSRKMIGVSERTLKSFKSKKEGEKDNEDYAATLLSLALCNAAKKLGNRFGRSLNSRGVLKVKDDKEKPSISELDLQIESVKKSMIEDGTYDNAIYLLSLYPNLKKNTTLKEIAESLKIKNNG